MNKPISLSIALNIDKFCPLISLNVYNNGTEFAKEMYSISDDEISVIMQAKKNFLTMVNHGPKNNMVTKTLTCSWTTMTGQKCEN